LPIVGRKDVEKRRTEAAGARFKVASFEDGRQHRFFFETLTHRRPKLKSHCERFAAFNFAILMARTFFIMRLKVALSFALRVTLAMKYIV
jgi:hypothetical protein